MPDADADGSHRLLGSLILAGGLLLALAAAGLWGHSSNSRSALRKFKGQLKAQGEKLTYAELSRSHTTNGSWSMARLVAAARQLDDQRLNPASLALPEFPIVGSAQVVWRDETPASSFGPRPWDWVAFAGELEALQKPLEDIRQALHEPAPDGGPGVSLISGPRVDFVGLRTVAHWLMGAVLSELRSGRLEEATRDLEALGAMGKVNRDEYTMVAQMIRVALVRLDTSVVWQALQAPGWTEAQLARVQTSFEDTDLLDALERGFLGERAMGAEFGMMLRQNPNALRVMFGGAPSQAPTLSEFFERGVGLPIYRMTSVDSDELCQLQWLQKGLEQVRSLRARQPWPQVARQSGTPASQASPALSRLQFLRFHTNRSAVPNSPKAMERAVENETQRRMALAALALTRYRLRHGSYPASLAALAPEFLSAVPYDPMSGDWLRYRLRHNGGFLLYSVGKDGHDDGGDGLLDTVWPTAASGGHDSTNPSANESVIPNSNAHQ